MPGTSTNTESGLPAGALEELRAAVREVIRDELESAPSPSDDPLLSIRQVAARLGVSKRTAEGIVKRGELRPIWVSGNCRRFDPEALEAFIARKAREGKR